MRAPCPLVGQDDSRVVVWLRPSPREILDLDHLMRIVNRRTKGVLPPVKLLQKMRDMLMWDKEREDKGSWVEATRAAPICALDLFPKG